MKGERVDGAFTAAAAAAIALPVLLVLSPVAVVGVLFCSWCWYCRLPLLLPFPSALVVEVAGGDNGLCHPVGCRLGSTQVWSFKALGPISGSPALSSTAILVASDDGTLYSVSPTTGTAQWTFSFTTYGGYGSPAIGSDGTVCTGVGR